MGSGMMAWAQGGGLGPPPPPEDEEMEILEKRRVKSWQAKTKAADKDFDEWNDDFNCDLLEDYYLGHQWGSDEEAQDNYTINLCYPTVEIKLPSMLFYRPTTKIKAKPARADDMMSLLDARAKLHEDLARSLMADRSVYFDEETKLALRESFYRFGVVEVGYTADTVDNPNTGKPILHEDTGQPMIDTDDQPLMHGPQVVSGEGIWVRRIPAKQFRASATLQNNCLHLNEWVGYWAYEHLEDVKGNPNYRNTGKLKAFARSNDRTEAGEVDKEDEDEREKKHGMVKVWKIWDLRQRTKRVFVDGANKFLQEIPFRFLPLALLKFNDILDKLYPLPPMSQWKSPQDELNETRHMQKIHRRRFYRRYLVRAGAMDDEQLKRLEYGGDGVYAETGDLDCIKPVPDAPLDRGSVAALIPETRRDFQEITSVGGEQRQVTETKTATQANLIDANMRIRDSLARSVVAKWLADIVFIMLETSKDNMALPMLINRVVDPVAPMAVPESLAVAQTWAMITSEDLGSLDYEVTIDIESMSPVTEEMEKNQWTQVLGILSQPGLIVLLSASDVLLRRTLGYYGIKSDNDINQIKMAMQMVLMLMQATAGVSDQPGKPPAGAGAKKPAATPTPTPGPVPGMDGILRQLNGQMGVTGGRPS